jgi:hypothetical protein
LLFVMNIFVKSYAFAIIIEILIKLIYKYFLIYKSTSAFHTIQNEVDTYKKMKSKLRLIILTYAWTVRSYPIRQIPKQQYTKFTISRFSGRTWVFSCYRLCNHLFLIDQLFIFLINQITKAMKWFYFNCWLSCLLVFSHSDTHHNINGREYRRYWSTIYRRST